MNKKAVSMAFIVAAIILLLLTISLIFFVGTIFQKTETKTVEDKCRVSVQQEIMINAGAKIGRAGHTVRDFASNIKCSTIPIDLKGKKDDLAGLTFVLMKKCWDLFGQGSELFSRGDGTFCHTCYMINLDKGASFSLDDLLKSRELGTLEGHYDVPQQIVGEQQAIVFSYKKDASGVKSFVHVASIDQLPAVCKNAEFPQERA